MSRGLGARVRRRWAAPAAGLATGLLLTLSAVRWELARRALADAALASVADADDDDAASVADADDDAAAPAAGDYGRGETGDYDPGAVDVLIPIRSGDPLLGQRLTASVATLAGARVHLLVDDDDEAARRVADLLDTGAGEALSAAGAGEALGPTLRVESFPPPQPGVNPKVVKLAAAVRRIEARGGLRPVLVQLDDDTLLPPGGLAGLLRGLDRAALATALPVYLEQGSAWSRLVAGFVNSSALTTYLPLARLAPPVSVNGMALALRARDLAAVGGYEAIARATCDDYALARAFRRRGLAIAQTAQPVLLATTVAGPAAYARLLRRWLLFAGEVTRRDASARLVILGALPSVLPLAALALAALVPGPGRRRAVGGALAALGATQTATWWLRRRWLARVAPGMPAPSLAGLGYEIAAVLLTPLHLLGTLGPRTVAWRGRRVRVGVGE